MIKEKIITPTQLKSKIQELRSAQKKIVIVSGSFDVFHVGHVDLLQNSKKQGDILLVLLNSDKSVQKYKGQNRPFFDLNNRLAILTSNIFVDLVTVFDTHTPLDILKNIEFDVFVNGEDYGSNFLERDVVEKKKAKIFINKRIGASSDLVSKIKQSKDSKKAVFFDRDGVLIYDKHYLHKVSDVKFMPGIIPLLKKLSQKGYLLVGVSNQSGVGRKMFKESDVKKVHKFILENFRENGINFLEILYCPHAPEKKCKCRKPGTELLEKAAAKYDIALGRSYMIGDKLSDIEAGKMVNAKTIFLGNLPENVSSVEYPNHVCNNLKEVAMIFK